MIPLSFAVLFFAASPIPGVPLPPDGAVDQVFTEIYAGRDVDFPKLVANILEKNRLRGPGADANTPVILQTFSEMTVRTLASMKLGLPLVYLVENAGIACTARGRSRRA